MVSKDLLKKCDLFGEGPSKESSVITLYHGSPYREVTPTFGKGKDQHDYGRGFYLTPDIELAKEWAVSRPTTKVGWLHTYHIDTSGMAVIDFESFPRNKALYWVTELLRHREPDFTGDEPVYYHQYKEFLFKHFLSPTERADLICGWRADDSYFKIVEYLMRDEIEIADLEGALRLGNLGIQYCCKSSIAYERLICVCPPIEVPISLYRKRYTERDSEARSQLKGIRDKIRSRSPRGTITMRNLVFGR